MRQKRIAAALAAMVLAASLTACSQKDSSDISETGTNTALTTENTENGTDETSEETTDASGSVAQSETVQNGTAAKTDGTVSSGNGGTEPAVSGITQYDSVPAEAEPAFDVLIGFVEACRQGDTDKIISQSNFKLLMEEAGGSDINAAAAEMKIDQYWIGGCTQNKLIVNEYLEYRNDVIERVKDMEGEDKQTAEKYLKMMPEIDDLWIFDMTLKMASSDKQEDHPFYVMHTKDGWTVDLSILSAMSGYVGKSKIVSANSTAKNINNAFQSALIDADATGLRVKLLAGDYDFSGKDFAGLETPDRNQSDPEAAGKTAVLDYVKYLVKKYYEEITEVTAFKITISESGDVKAVAVAIDETTTVTDAKTGRKLLVFGTYPRQITKDDLADVRTLQQALDYAKREG